VRKTLLVDISEVNDFLEALDSFPPLPLKEEEIAENKRRGSLPFPSNEPPTDMTKSINNDFLRAF
jgi:hypothetical protein